MNRSRILLIVLCALLVSCSGVESILQTAPTAPSIAPTVLQTETSTGQRTQPITYTVEGGDNLFSLADKFKLHPETILWANSDLLADNPHRLGPGMAIVILPVNGIYYTWRSRDDLQAVAARHGVKPADIVNWPANQLDRQRFENGVQPDIQPGTRLIIPGGNASTLKMSCGSTALPGLDYAFYRGKAFVAELLPGRHPGRSEGPHPVSRDSSLRSE